MSIATFSDSLKIFGGDDAFFLSATVPINKTNETFGRISWSGDAKWITVTPVKRNNDPLAVFKYKDKQLDPVKYISISSITSASFFNWTNRYIAVGAETGDIYVWDLKEKKISVKFDCHKGYSVNHLCVNSDDTSLASGSLNSNEVFIHSLKTNKILKSFTIPESQHASCLCYCMCKKSYLAASSYESTICVWDIARSDVVFKLLNSHSGACTGISFSPINYSVMASVSLTKTLKMYDLREKTSIFDVNIGEPMQCVDMISNGDKIAVGTTNGLVILYDLRANKIYQTIKAYESPVLSVKMQSMKIPKVYQEIDMNTPDVVEIQSKTLEFSVLDVFSPIARVSENKSVSSTKTVSFHSTPKVIVSESDSILPYEDSFLSKMLSPKKANIVISTPIDQDMSSCKNNDFSLSNSKLQTVEEEPANFSPTLPECGVEEGGDGVHNGHFIPDNISLQCLLRDVKTIQLEHQKSISLLSQQIMEIKKDLHEMKLQNESKHQILQENYENIIHVLVDNIKEEIYSGNCNSKLEHICQRLLINNVSNSISESSDKILNEMNKYAQLLNLIHKQLTNPHK